VEGVALSRAQEDALLSELSSTLSKYEIPKRLVYLGQFVETRTQKVDRLSTIDAIRRQS
jgi:hypothetical protein